MKILNIIAGVLAVLLLVLAGILVYMLAGSGSEGIRDTSPASFSVLESGSAGDYDYAVFSYRGSGNLTAIGTASPLSRNLVVINDSQAIQATRLDELVAQLNGLEAYGYTVTVTNEQKIGSGIYVLPTGAIPAYALFNLQLNSSNGTIIYIGAPDLLISSGTKQTQWYRNLGLAQRSRMVLYDTTLDDMLENQSFSLAHEILYATRASRSDLSMRLSGNGIRTIALPRNSSTNLRLIYDMPNASGVYDSGDIVPSAQYLLPQPASIYPWERSNLMFSLNRTNGTAYLVIKRDGKVVERRQLRRVTDQNVFIEKLSFDEPGEYLMSAEDDSGSIATGLLHVKDVQIQLAERRGTAYVFAVDVDGKPLQNSEADVWIGNSTDRRKFYISQGEIVVNTQLQQGTSVFNFDLSGSTIMVPVGNTQEPIFDFYLKYGLPGLLLVVGVYFAARMTRRPTYGLRFGDSAGYIRQEIAVPTGHALEAFKSVRKDMKLEGSPITPQEFSVALKRYLTNGADITEGNVEEILKRLEKNGSLESHRDYYQLKGEGDVKTNVLRRMVRENLIESGTSFQEKDGKFITKDFEIGFFGDKFSKKGLIIVDDKAEIKRILSGLTEREQARLRIMQSNSTIEFVPIDRLGSML